MKPLLLLLLLFLALARAGAQQKGEAEAGGRLVYFTDRGELGYGADFLLRLPSKGGGSIGAGLTPIYRKTEQEYYVLAYADLRMPLSQNLSFSFQPGYNFYNYPVRLFNWNPFVLREKSTEGRFCAGLGFTWHFSPERMLGQYLQVKYHYFRFEETTKSYSTPTDFVTHKRNTEKSALSIGLGVRF